MSEVVVRDEDARDLLVKSIGLVVYRMDNGRTETYVGGPGSGWTEEPPGPSAPS